MRIAAYSLCMAVLLGPLQAIAAETGRPAGVPPADIAAMAGGPHRHDHGPAQADQGWRGKNQEWTKYPLITPVMGGDGGRSGATLAVRNIQPAALEVFAAEGPADRLRRQFPVAPEGTRIEAVTPKIGNYHWVSAREEAEGKVTVASTVYPFGNPGEAPTRMLRQQKSELEIIPQPLPREHGAWRESEKWKFLVRFNGRPLANKRVAMETEFGTRTAFTSDGDGMVTVLFPRDFKPAGPDQHSGHHGGPTRARFVLAAEHDDGGKHYLTAFNYTYSPDAERDKSLLAGVGFGLFGMLLATPLLRRKQADKQNGKE